MAISNANPNVRLEHDLLGEKHLPVDAYYGIQTQRALENFKISGVTMQFFPEFIEALAEVKKASTLANYDLGFLSDEVKNAIVAACDEIIAGKFHDQFKVDMIQGGAGTSTNMNANEVIANRALEIMGHKKGDYDHCHPNNHVNMSQSTNDEGMTKQPMTPSRSGKGSSSSPRKKRNQTRHSHSGSRSWGGDSDLQDPMASVTGKNTNATAGINPMWASLSVLDTDFPNLER